MPKVAGLLKYRCLRWLGRIARMNHDRLPACVGTFMVKEGGVKPVKSWNDCILEDVDSMGFNVTGRENVKPGKDGKEMEK